MEEVLYEKQGGQVTWAGGGQTEAVLAKGAHYFLRGIIMWYFGTEGAFSPKAKVFIRIFRPECFGRTCPAGPL